METFSTRNLVMNVPSPAPNSRMFSAAGGFACLIRSNTASVYRTASCITSRIRLPSYSVVCVMIFRPDQPDSELPRHRCIAGQPREYPKLSRTVIDNEARYGTDNFRNEERHR